MKINFIEKGTRKNLYESEMFPINNGDLVGFKNTQYRVKSKFYNLMTGTLDIEVSKVTTYINF